MSNIPRDDQTNELRSGIASGFEKKLNEALQIGPSIKYWISNKVRPSLLMGVLKGTQGTPGLVAAISAEKDSVGNIRLSTSSAKSLTGKTILYDNTFISGGTGTLRTVTTGKVYYLLASGLQYHATTDEKDAKLYVGVVSNLLLWLTSSITATYKISDTDAIKETYPYPITVSGGTAIIVSSSDAGLKASAWIIGYEEDE